MISCELQVQGENIRIDDRNGISRNHLLDDELCEGLTLNDSRWNYYIKYFNDSTYCGFHRHPEVYDNIEPLIENPNYFKSEDKIFRITPNSLDPVFERPDKVFTIDSQGEIYSAYETSITHSGRVNCLEVCNILRRYGNHITALYYHNDNLICGCQNGKVFILVVNEDRLEVSDILFAKDGLIDLTANDRWLVSVCSEGNIQVKCWHYSKRENSYLLYPSASSNMVASAIPNIRSLVLSDFVILWNKSEHHLISIEHMIINELPYGDDLIDDFKDINNKIKDEVFHRIFRDLSAKQIKDCLSIDNRPSKYLAIIDYMGTASIPLSIGFSSNLIISFDSKMVFKTVSVSNLPDTHLTRIKEKFIQKFNAEIHDYGLTEIVIRDESYFLIFSRRDLTNPITMLLPVQKQLPKTYYIAVCVNHKIWSNIIEVLPKWPITQLLFITTKDLYPFQLALSALTNHLKSILELQDVQQDIAIMLDRYRESLNRFEPSEYL